MEAAVNQPLGHVVAALQDNSPGAVAEQDATAAIGVIGDPAERFGAEHEYVIVQSRFDERRPGLKRVKKSAASGADVKRRRGMQPERRRNETGGGRENHFARNGSADNEVEIGGLQPGGLERFAGGAGGKRRRGFTLGGNSPFADAGTLHDPFVVGIDRFRKLGVG